MQSPAAAPRQHRYRSRGVHCAAATVEFAKYHGLGNDFILVTPPPASGTLVCFPLPPDHLGIPPCAHALATDPCMLTRSTIDTRTSRS